MQEPSYSGLAGRIPSTGRIIVETLHTLTPLEGQRHFYMSLAQRLNPNIGALEKAVGGAFVTVLQLNTTIPALYLLYERIHSYF